LKMTLAVAIEAVNGIVLASDSRATFGDLRGLTTVNDTVVKIFKPAPKVAVALSGHGEIGNSLMQRITAVASEPANANADVDQIAETIRTVGNHYFTQWFGNPTWLLGANGPVPTPRPDICYLLAGYTQAGQPKIIALPSSPPLNFAPSVVTTGFGTIGIVPLAIFLLNRLYRRGIDVEIAKDLAAYCIIETASQDGKVGGQMHMAIVRRNAETEIISDADITRLGIRVDAHREALRNSFLTLEQPHPPAGPGAPAGPGQPARK
jgi:20S proteasome alpha/beta subunit